MQEPPIRRYGPLSRSPLAQLPPSRLRRIFRSVRRGEQVDDAADAELAVMQADWELGQRPWWIPPLVVLIGAPFWGSWLEAVVEGEPVNVLHMAVVLLIFLVSPVVSIFGDRRVRARVRRSRQANVRLLGRGSG